MFLGIISPLMLAMQLRGDHETMMDMANDPELLKELLRRTTDFILEYAREAVEAGADQLILDDSLSNSDFLTLEQFRTFAEPYEDRVANEMRKMDIESILHVCGKVSEAQLDRMIEIDVDAISIDEAVPILMAKRVGARKHTIVRATSARRRPCSWGRQARSKRRPGVASMMAWMPLLQDAASRPTHPWRT